MRSLTFVIDDVVDTRITITELENGSLRFDVNVVEEGGAIGDLRALYLDLAGTVASGSLKAIAIDPVTGQPLASGTGSITGIVSGEGRITSVGGDTNVNGSVINEFGRFDLGIAFGTAGIGKDDIQQTSFILQGPGLTLDMIAGQDLGLRYTSVGTEGGVRTDGLKIGGEVGRLEAQNDAVAVAENTTQANILNLLANDGTVGTHTVTAAQWGGTTAFTATPSGQLVSDLTTDGLTFGTITINPDGSVDANMNGPAADGLALGESKSFTFTYTSTGPNGLVSTATATITLNGVNDAPEAQDSAASTSEDTGQTIDVSSLISDVDTAAGELTIGASVDPVQGEVTVSGKVITFTPAKDFFGTATISYTVTDATGTSVLSDTASIAVQVAAVNDAPEVSNSSIGVAMGTPYVSSISASDVDGDTLSYRLLDGPDHGTLTLNPDGTYTYEASADHPGADRFEVEVADGKGGVAVSTVNVAVSENSFKAPGGQTGSLVLDGEGSGGPLGNMRITLSEVTNAPINVSFALDSSGSLSNTNWNTIETAVVAAVTKLHDQFLGSGVPITVQIIQYGTGAFDRGQFDLMTQLPQLKAAITNMTHLSTNTNWASALTMAEGFFDKVNPVGGSDETNILYFVTDGIPSPTNQPWRQAYTNLTNEETNGYDVDVQTFGIGSALSTTFLKEIDSDGTVITMAAAGDLAAAITASPLFAAELVDLSLNLTADGVSKGEIANETNSALKADGLNYNLALAEIAGLADKLGSQNQFTVKATFDLDNDAATLGDRIELNASLDMSKKATAQNVAGSTGSDLILGSDFADRLSGGAGNDLLMGYGGNDTFVLSAGSGKDTIVDFEAGAGAGDMLDLRNVAAFAGADLGLVLARSTQVGANTVIDLADGHGGQIVLAGVQISSLASDDFLLV